MTEEERIDALMDEYDTLLLEDKFSECAERLAQLDVGSLSISEVISVLAITRAAKERLPGWGVFLQRATDRLTELAPTRVGRLLGGLH